MDWPWEIAEREHEIQNPTSAGKGGPATILAAAYGCTVTGVEIRPRRALLGWAILVGRKPEAPTLSGWARRP